MHQLTTTATFTEHPMDDDSLTTIVARSVLEAALAEDERAQLWFEVGRDDDGSTRLAVDLSNSDLEELLRLSGGDDVALTLDSDYVAGLFDDPDVEAHGLKGALAIAVASAAILAPAGQAAVTQGVSAAVTTQGVGAAAATTQGVGAATTTQVAASATTQVSSLVAKAQVSSVQAKTQGSKTLVLKASGFSLQHLAG